MTLRADHITREHLAWAQWWAFPWHCAHEDWRGDEYPALAALPRAGRLAPGNFAGIATCLPPAPHPIVLRLALATAEQLTLALTLIRGTFNPDAAAALNESHHLWCMRLSKAMPAELLMPEADPLRLLHSWVEPVIWQRLRLRFPRKRVLDIEKATRLLENATSRLNTLLQAVVWRATSTASDPLLPDLNG